MKNNNKFLILSILFTPNNILYYMTWSNGHTIFWTSSGTIKSHNMKKTTSISIAVAIKYIIKKLNHISHDGIYVKIKGFSKNKKNVIKQLKQSTLNILFISDKILWPHNGCKQKKRRRV